jgi:RNA polymerase sigma factor (sigma-70 family)
MKVHFKIQGQAISAEVTIEVYEYIEQSDRKTENLAHEQRRHWDSRGFNESIIASESMVRYSETPEEWYIRKETLQEIMEALESCTGVQRQRFFLFALDGLNYSEIARLYGCSKYAVRDSIATVRKKCSIFFKHRPHEKPFSG